MSIVLPMVFKFYSLSWSLTKLQFARVLRGSAPKRFKAEPGYEHNICLGSFNLVDSLTSVRIVESLSRLPLPFKVCKSWRIAVKVNLRISYSYFLFIIYFFFLFFYFIMSKFFCDAPSVQENRYDPTLVLCVEEQIDGSRAKVVKCVETMNDPLANLCFEDFTLQSMLKHGVNYKSLQIPRDMRMGSDSVFDEFDKKLESMEKEIFVQPLNK